MSDSDNSATLTPRNVPAKVLPVPKSVSPELQRSISMLASMPSVADVPVPETAAGWRVFIAAMDDQSRVFGPILAARFPHKITKQEIAGVTVREVTPDTFDPAKAGRLLIQFHGGGYVLGGGEASTSEAVLCAHYSGMRVISVDYRMPPDHPYPAALEDAFSVWEAVVADRDPASVGVFGTSAGGALTLSLGLRLKGLGLPLPGALAPCTPGADLSGAGDSWVVNADVDGLLPRPTGLARAMGDLYVGTASRVDPLLSPVFGDFAGFPPTIFTTGTRDIVLSDTVRTHRAMRAAGVDARLEVHEGMSHAQYISAFDSPECSDSVERHRRLL